MTESKFTAEHLDELFNHHHEVWEGDDPAKGHAILVADGFAGQDLMLAGLTLSMMGLAKRMGYGKISLEEAFRLSCIKADDNDDFPYSAFGKDLKALAKALNEKR